MPAQKNITYIILGASGFIGKSLCRRLRDEQVIAIGRSVTHVPSGREKYYSVEKYSLDEIAATLTGLENVIIDLSYTSVSNVNAKDPGRDFSNNINLIIDNLRFAKNVRTRKFLYVSSGGSVYGKTPDQQIAENHPTNPISQYGIIKLASEKYTQMFCPVNGLDYNIIRPSNVYGPGQIPFQGQGIIATALGSAFQQTPITIYGKGDNVRDYIYIDDLCEWLMAICTGGRSGEIYNAGSAKGYSIMEITGFIRSMLGDRYELPVDFMPDRPFDVKRNVLDNSRITAATGFGLSTDLEQGIEHSWEWVKEFMTAGTPLFSKYLK